jgi:small subunit ribosomal protein S21
LPRVNVRENEPIDKAIRRFKRLCTKEGIFKEIRERRRYTKPSEKRRRQLGRGRRRK